MREQSLLPATPVLEPWPACQRLSLRPRKLLGRQSAWARGPEELALAQGCRLRAERAQLGAWAGAGARAADGVLFFILLFIWVVTGI